MAPDQVSDDVRNHLANERTFLAWVRTSVSTMGFGIVIAKLRYLLAFSGKLETNGKLVHASQIGLSLTSIGLLLLVASTWRFVSVQKQIRDNSYKEGIVLPLFLAAVIFALGVVILVYLLT